MLCRWSASNFVQLWKRVDHESRAALALLDLALPAAADRWADARDYLDHNEFGVAFDIIVDALLESDTDDVRPALAYLETVHSEWGHVDDERGWQLLRQRLS